MFSFRNVFDACSLIMGIAYLVFFAACGYSEGPLVFLNGAYAFGSIGFASLFLFVGGKCHE